uniref:NEDD8-activating enzyme E1 regulatory subunit n=1 Tax=Kwoniella bestiolae CBS 10118 TaxID=1296100 RepID=A0A1B9GBI0_9TREE|nr:amyloid beta protein binding protein 1 [Kwoniella bestiolae CBS 10118]OCF28367.1 amyloid beta protein binding protein 1 [Kwoniella bestiolae CBS 10118]
MPSSPPSGSDQERRPTKITKMDDSIDVTHATTGTAEIPSYRPDAKTRRYDRQLRLWASAGQRSLESARVLLVGCDATGCQALKNLVLPGISHFTILSPHLTTSQDVATNFFLHPDSVGSPIAEQSVKYLKELNPAVDGSPRELSSLLVSEPEFFTSFTLILASNIEPAFELQLADLLWDSNVGGPDIPLIAIRNSGFIGRVEIQLREHSVVDTHPDTTHTLRLDEPFPSLEEHARSLDLSTMDSMEHSHIPWVVLLVRAASLWKESRGGKLPGTSEEKARFKKSIKEDMMKGDEENYEEALAQAYRVWSKSEVPWEIKQLLEDESVKNISSSSKNLQILLHTLSLFTSIAPHLPPTSPSLPDMHSSTTSYVHLQNLYKKEYQTDLARFKQLLSEVLGNIDLEDGTIPDEEVEGFVKNVGGVGIIKGTPLRASKEGKGLITEQIKEYQYDEYDGSTTCFAMHLALLASEQFFIAHKRWPGAKAQQDMSEDNREVEEILKGILGKKNLEEVDDIFVECIAEVTRGGFGTLPTTAAFLGGVVAQEAIKLVTNQYTPLDNTVIVNLVKSESAKFKF